MNDIEAKLAKSGIIEKLSQSAAETRKAKYLDVRHWLEKTQQDAIEAGVMGSDPLHILDLGTGPGYFPAICKKLGHSCVGLDRPGQRFFAKLRDCLDIDVVEYKILPMAPFPSFSRRFDLVTAFRAPFDIIRTENRVFSFDEWVFFLDDLRDNVLHPGGRLFMRINKDHPFEGPPLERPSIRELFQSRGANIDGRVVNFQTLK